MDRFNPVILAVEAGQDKDLTNFAFLKLNYDVVFIVLASNDYL